MLTVVILSKKISGRRRGRGRRVLEFPGVLLSGVLGSINNKQCPVYVVCDFFSAAERTW